MPLQWSGQAATSQEQLINGIVVAGGSRPISDIREPSHTPSITLQNQQQSGPLAFPFEMHPRFTVGIIVLIVAFARNVQAAPTNQDAEVGKLLAEAAAKEDQARVLKRNAKEQFERDKAECHRTILVSSCIDSARERMNHLVSESKQLAATGQQAKRKASQLEHEAKLAKRGADEPIIEERNRQQIEKYQREKLQNDMRREEAISRDEIEMRKRRARQELENAKRQKRHEEQARNEVEAASKRPALLKAQEDRIRAANEHAAKVYANLNKKAEQEKRREAEEAAKRVAAEGKKNEPRDDGSFLCWVWPERFCRLPTEGK